MNPLMTFSAGIMAGVAVVRLLKNDRARRSVAAAETIARDAVSAGREKTVSGFETAQTKLRNAAIAGLESVEKSSARLRTKLTPASEVAGVEAAAVAAAQVEAVPEVAVPGATEVKAAAKRAPRRKAAPRAKKQDSAAS